MRIKWGFLTSLTVLALVVSAQADETSKKAGQKTPAADQVPLRADLSYGWSQAIPPTAAVQPASYGAPGYAPQGPPPAWPGAAAPGGYGAFPAGPLMPASFQGGPEMPQPFPGPAPIPLDPGAAPMYGVGLEDETNVQPPYPGPFDGWIDERANCPMCYGGGCDHCSAIGGGFLGWLVTGMKPYGEGGICAPRWYDITLDAMYLSREDVGRNFPITSDGINGNIILSTADLDLDERLGFRFTGATQVTAGMIAEFTYFGFFNWASQRSILNTNVGDMFSFYSNFGTNPFNGFDETDRSSYQEIDYSSTIDNFELNVRRRWAAPNCQYQGSWLCGVRYVYMREDFGYHTNGGDDILTPGVIEVLGRQATDVMVRNSLTGFQVGMDLWTTVIPGVSIGGEVKGGVMGNYANQRTTVYASTTLPPAASTLVEEAGMKDIAFTGEGRFELIYRTGPNWTLRAGYTAFFVDGVALAAENLNAAAPPNLSGVGLAPRTPSRNDNGNALYHGGHFGVEYIW